MGEVLTLDKILQMQELIEPYNSVKEQFFKKFFPNIKDIDEWVLFLPATKELLILRFVEGNSWVIFNSDVPTPMVVKNTAYDPLGSMSV